MKSRAVARNVPGRRRRRGSARLFVLTAGVVAAAAVSSPTATLAQQQGPAVVGSPDQSSVRRYDVPAGPLRTVLAEFERVAQIKAVFADDGLQGLQSPGLAGNYTPEQAMAQLLRGMPVRATFDADSVSLTVRPLNEFVEVSASGPRPQSLKYGDSLRDTPQTIVVIPQQVLQQQSAISLRDALRNTPGITISVGEGASGTVAAGDQFLVRGFNARNDIYIDGARDPGEIARDMFNTELVEVAKGPNSAVGGRGTTGGSINLVTKSPTLQNSSQFRLTGGNADHGRATMDVNHRLAPSVALRLNAVWHDTGYPGREIARYKSWGFAPSVSFGLGTPTTVTVGYSRLKQDNIPDWGLPALLPDAAVAQGITVLDLDRNNWYGLLSRDYEKTTSDSAAVTVEHQFNRVFSLRNLTRYSKHFRDGVLTAPRPALNVAGSGPGDPGYDPAAAQIRRTDAKYQHRDDKALTNQTDLTSTFTTGSISHSTDVGVEFSRDMQPTYAFIDTFGNGRPPVNDLFNPTPAAPYTPTFARTGASSDATAVSAGVFAFDTIRFSSKIQADLGLRWDYVDIDYVSVATNGVATPFGRTDRAVTGRAGVVYKPVERASLYVSYGKSFNPSYDGTHGLTVAATGFSAIALEPERTRNTEVGVKFDFARSMQFNAALFEMRKDNARTVDLTGATVLAGDQQVKGVEIGLSGNITDRWGAFMGAALMDGVVKGSGTISEVGQKLAYVPKASLNFWSTYRLPMDLTIGGGANFSDGHFFNQTGTFNFVSNRFDTRYVQNAAEVQRLTRYWVFNAVAIYPINKHLEIQVNANNLTNTYYADRAYDRHFLAGPARQILVSPTISF